MAVAAPMTATTSKRGRGQEEEDVAAGHHIDSGGDHGGGVDQGADRRRAFHGIGKPGIEGNLGRFARGPHEEQQGDQGHQPARPWPISPGPAAKTVCEIEGSEGHEDQEDGQQKPVIADPVDDEGLLAGVGGRFLLIPEADQEIRTEPHPFPADEHEEKIVGRNQDEHEEDEEVEVGEVAGEVPDRRACSRGNRCG